MYAVSLTLFGQYLVLNTKAWVAFAKSRSLPEFVYSEVKTFIAGLCLVSPQVFPFDKNFAKLQNIKDAVVLGWGRQSFEKWSQTMGITTAVANAFQRYTKNDTREKKKLKSSSWSLIMDGVAFPLAQCSQMNSRDLHLCQNLFTLR